MKGVVHYIADDLARSFIEDWAGVGITELERYLTKRAAFIEFLEERDA